MKKKIIIISLVCVICALALGIALTAQTTEAEYEVAIFGEASHLAGAGFTRFAENYGYALYVDADTGVFYVEHLATGKIISSNPLDDTHTHDIVGRFAFEMQSQIMITFFNTYTHLRETINSAQASVQHGHFRALPVENGVMLEYSFHFRVTRRQVTGLYSFGDVLGALIGREDDSEEYEVRTVIESVITVPLEITLEEGGFRAHICRDSIIEDGGIVLLNIAVLPYMAAASPDCEGFILLPDGSGAIINFNNGKYRESPYNVPVFGENITISAARERRFNTVPVSLPIYALSHTDYTLLAMLESSAAAANLVARANGTLTPFGIAFFEFRIRELDTFRNVYIGQTYDSLCLVDLEINDISIRFHWLKQPENPIVEIADIAANFLRPEGQDITSPPAFDGVVNITGAIYPRDNIMGIPVNRRTALTTYAQASTMIRELNANANVAVQLSNWSDRSIRGNPRPNFSRSSTLGSSREWNALLDNHQDVLFFGANFNSYIRGNFLDETRHSARSIFDAPVRLPVFMRSRAIAMESWNIRASILLNAAAIENSAQGFLDGVGDRNVGITGFDMLYSDFGTGRETPRTAMLDLYLNIMRTYGESRSLMLTAAHFDMLPLADIVMTTPTRSNGFRLFDGEVPLFQMVASRLTVYGGDIINHSSSPERAFLRTISLGAIPAFDLTYRTIRDIGDITYSHLAGNEYGPWRQDIERMLADSRYINQRIPDKRIMAYEEIEQDVFVTTFPGHRLLVNMSDEPVIFKGVNVDSMGFAVFDGGIGS